MIQALLQKLMTKNITDKMTRFFSSENDENHLNLIWRCFASVDP